jgi:hypothetical protein
MAQFGIDVAGVVFGRVDMQRGAEQSYGSSYYADASKYYIN